MEKVFETGSSKKGLNMVKERVFNSVQCHSKIQNIFFKLHILFKFNPIIRFCKLPEGILRFWELVFWEFVYPQLLPQYLAYSICLININSLNRWILESHLPSKIKTSATGSNSLAHILIFYITKCKSAQWAPHLISIYSLFVNIKSSVAEKIRILKS